MINLFINSKGQVEAIHSDFIDELPGKKEVERAAHVEWHNGFWHVSIHGLGDKMALFKAPTRKQALEFEAEWVVGELRKNLV